MTIEIPSTQEPPLDRALDQALQRVLPASQLPDGFHDRLRAVIASNGAIDVASQRVRLEREYRAQQDNLRQGYVRLRRQTLGTLIGISFLSGVLLTLAMPWLRTQLGEHAALVIPAAASVLALMVAGSICLPRLGMPRFLS